MTKIGSPIFPTSQIKNESSTVFINDFIYLNNQLKFKPYRVTNINEMLLKLENFNYYKSLDLNMAYCHIKLS